MGLYVFETTRRCRCEIRGCNKKSCLGFGSKGNDYFLCKEHADMIESQMRSLLAVMDERERLAKVKERAELRKAEKAAAEVTEVVDEATEEATEETTEEVQEIITPVEPEEFYQCKYCGQKFNKKTIELGEYMAHAKKCKKEHEK